MSSRQRPYRAAQPVPPPTSRGASPARLGVEAVPQTGERVQRPAALHAGEYFRAAPGGAADQRQPAVLGMAHGKRPPEKFARHRYFRELPRNEGRGVPGQHELENVPGQREIGDYFQRRAFHMVDTFMVISSSTSSRAFTVSSAVKVVTPFSLAHWRIS
jgi:hypothetical protein